MIVVNDGSTDNTREVLAAYKSHPQVRVIHKENGKLPRALNTGFEAARGRYLTWTSTDNYMHPHMLTPSLDKPVLVLRESTERPEAVTARAARLVGTDEQRIIGEVQRLLHDADHYNVMASWIIIALDSPQPSSSVCRWCIMRSTLSATKGPPDDNPSSF
ncbi:MAG: glycosyltransferase [Caldilineaceae bacterium]